MNSNIFKFSLLLGSFSMAASLTCYNNFDGFKDGKLSVADKYSTPACSPSMKKMCIKGECDGIKFYSCTDTDDICKTYLSGCKSCIATPCTENLCNDPNADKNTGNQKKLANMAKPKEQKPDEPNANKNNGNQYKPGEKSKAPADEKPKDQKLADEEKPNKEKKPADGNKSNEKKPADGEKPEQKKPDEKNTEKPDGEKPVDEKPKEQEHKTTDGKEPAGEKKSDAPTDGADTALLRAMMLANGLVTLMFAGVLI